MDKLPYRVCEGANLALYPRGTKVGNTVMLTDAQALYERDMGRLELAVEPAAAEAPALEAAAAAGFGAGGAAEPEPEGEPAAEAVERAPAPKPGKVR